VKEVEEKDAKQKARGIQHNPYTNISAQDVKAQWKQFELLVQKKQALLEEAIKESKRAGLSEEQVLEIKDNFGHFDKDKVNYINCTPFFSLNSFSYRMES